jgi:hypothetical protein
MATMAPIENEGLMAVDAEALTVVAATVVVTDGNEAEPVLQLLGDVQHDTTVPAVVEPALEAGHVVPDATHEYVLVAVPDNQTEEVFIFKRFENKSIRKF